MQKYKQIISKIKSDSEKVNFLKTKIQLIKNAYNKIKDKYIYLNDVSYSENWLNNLYNSIVKSNKLCLSKNELNEINSYDDFVKLLTNLEWFYSMMNLYSSEKNWIIENKELKDKILSYLLIKLKWDSVDNNWFTNQDTIWLDVLNNRKYIIPFYLKTKWWSNLLTYDLCYFYVMSTNFYNSLFKYYDLRNDIINWCRSYWLIEAYNSRSIILNYATKSVWLWYNSLWNVLW